MTNATNIPLIKPSDAKSWSLCARRVWLDNKAGFKLASVENAFEQLIIDLGLAHELDFFRYQPGVVSTV